MGRKQNLFENCGSQNPLYHKENAVQSGNFGIIVSFFPRHLTRTSLDMNAIQYQACLYFFPLLSHLLQNLLIYLVIWVLTFPCIGHITLSKFYGQRKPVHTVDQGSVL